MRRTRSALCALCLLLLIPLILHARRFLPLDNRPLVAEKYSGWSGVLRLWVFEGWPCGQGGISPWLYRCISRFEKSHPGVYVQPHTVDAGSIATMNESGISRPDMLLFPPDLLEAPTGLLPLTPPETLRPGLVHCGDWNDTCYALPVAMGGYMWAWNTAQIERLPDTWHEADIPLAVPPPEPWRRWDAALLALCSRRYAPSREDESPAPSADLSGGMDLGLAESETPAPTAAPSEDAASTLPRRLPDDFQYDDDAWNRFVNGEAAAMPVTQREVCRLQALSERGRGPDWQLSPGDGAFSDQLLCLAVVDRPDAEDRRALCEAFAMHLLSEESQRELHLATAFSVTHAPSGYESSDPLSAMDALLHDSALVVPRCFDLRWTEDAASIAFQFVSNSQEAPALWRLLVDRLGKRMKD